MNVQSAWGWGGVGQLLATILAGKKMAEFSIGHDYYSFLCWQISFLGLNFECRFDCFLNKQFLRPEKPENMDGKEQRPSPPFMKEVYMICFFPVD